MNDTIRIAECYIAAHGTSWRNEKHKWQWGQTLKAHAFPVIGDKPVEGATTGDVMRILEPIWQAKPETASRLRGRMGDQLASRARAAAGANGIDPNSGSALSNQLDIGRQTGIDVANEKFNAGLAAWGFRNQSSLDTAQAAAAESAGSIGAATSILGGVSQLSSQWAGYQRSGVFGSPSGSSSWGSGPNINWATTG